jgi:membrane protein YdbS with pleckstrin-like domain
MLKHATRTSAGMDHVVYLDTEANSAAETGSWRPSPTAWRSAWIAVAIALLSAAGATITAMFYLNDPHWVKWGVGLVLGFNILVAARLLLTSRGVRATGD